MGLNSGVLKRYLISIYTIKGWYDIARPDCILLKESILFRDLLGKRKIGTIKFSPEVLNLFF